MRGVGHGLENDRCRRMDRTGDSYSGQVCLSGPSLGRDPRFQALGRATTRPTPGILASRSTRAATLPAPAPFNRPSVVRGRFML